METTTKREFKEVRISVPWGHIAARWYGNNQTRPILALHGWLDNLGTWETLVPLMPQHIGVLCIDLPGHGLSSHLPRGMSYQVIDYVGIIVRIMKAYNWQKVSLMGHSMGAQVCFIFSSLFPHKVDLFVSIDVVKPFPRYEGINTFRQLRMYSERLLIEDERLETAALIEPPSYTYDELERLLYEGSFNSVDLDKCKYILNRSITKSTRYPDKYYFSRDGRLKNYVVFKVSEEMTMEMARKVVNIPYLLVKGSESVHMNEKWEIIELLRRQNSQFEFYEISGTHHVHLNNPKAVAAVLNPFINHHRPARLVAWSLTEDVAPNASDSVKPEQQRVDVKPSSKL